MRKFTAMVSAAALAASALAPVAQAHDWRGYRGDYDGYGRHYRYDHGNAAAAGVVGLIFGLAVGAALSQPRADRCYDNCGASDYYGPPRGYYGRPPPRAYDEPGSAYEQDYGQAPYKSQCTRRERQWDRYANRYLTVDVPC
ncbi:MAG: hypothetical protein JSS00_12565 [Proteobacteria bacterium]|nr:hypothetical protein [Pseudomonadota bacterium]